MTHAFSPRRRTLVRGLPLLAATLAAPGLRAQSTPPAPVRIGLIEGLSGPAANAGEAVLRNLVWAAERVNARGGVNVDGAVRPLAIERLDSKGQAEEALSALRSAIDRGITVVAQGNSSAVASALVEAIEKHNTREPQRRVLLLNYAAVDPALTNERCSPWHFRFDAHADMRLAALLSVLQADRSVDKLYLIGQDYSFGQHVLREARRRVGELRPDIAIVGQELHPLARVKDFLPYAAKIQASGAQAVLTGNWGNDLTLLVKAARDAGYRGRFYTFYGNALGAPAAIGEAGVGQVLAVAEWFPNAPGESSAALVRAFRERFPSPADDYIHLRMQLMVEALAAALGRAGTAEAGAVARHLAQADVSLAGQRGRMRGADQQFQQPLMVAVMDRQGAPGVPFDVEGSGFGFRVVRTLTPEQATLPHACTMRPWN